MYIKEYPEILEHPNTRIHYIRKRVRSKTIDGKTIFYSTGPKRGVMISFLHPDDPNCVCLGWSICCSQDRWNYIRGVRIPNFGKNLAISKGLKFYPMNEIIIPESIFNLFDSFIASSIKYYKNKHFPAFLPSKYFKILE